MLKLVGDDVPSIEQFMSRYRVSIRVRSSGMRVSITYCSWIRWTTLPLFTD